jgi:hypothetical protein
MTELKIATDLPPLPPGTAFTRRPNGLHDIVREDHSAPVVSAQLRCCRGAGGCTAKLADSAPAA